VLKYDHLDTIFVGVESGNESDVIEIDVVSNIISRGDDTIDGRGLYPGLAWDCYPGAGRWNHAGDTIAYLINEGQILADTIEAYSDRDGEQSEVTWEVKPESIAVLRKHGIIS
jgi:hypothetical protein